MTEEIIDGHNKIVIANYGNRVEVNTYERSIHDENKWECVSCVGTNDVILRLKLKSIGVLND